MGSLFSGNVDVSYFPLKHFNILEKDTFVLSDVFQDDSASFFRKCEPVMVVITEDQLS